MRSIPRPRASSMTALAVTLAAAAALPACGRKVTNDPDAVRAAAVAGHTDRALEGIAVAASLLADVPPAALPQDAVVVARDVLNVLFLGCADIEIFTGTTAGLTIAFPDGGCRVPLTGVALQGTLTFTATTADDSSTWSLVLEDFVVPEFQGDGAVTVVILEGRSVTYDVEDLWVSVAGVEVTLNGAGVVYSAAGSRDVVFDGSGQVGYDGNTYGFDVDALSRRPSRDCYPESGRITVSLRLENGLDASATVDFKDHGGLDTDDSGLVKVTIEGRSLTAALPERACD
ncbi:MAG TPA: hypothetical protein VG389_26010 [Myxococcota bacterium]|nr:hypothetical protein [Myxococcota bacterium]